MKSTRKYKKVQESTRKKMGAFSFPFFFVPFCTFLYLFVPLAKISAQSPTPTMTPRPEADQPLVGTISEEEVQNSLQERLKKAAQEKGEKADQVLGAKNKLAVVGKLSDISNNTLTIRARGETNELVTTDSETIFVRNNKTVKREDIQIGDWVIAMGQRGDNGNSVVIAKRVVAKDKQTEYPKRVSVKGVVKSKQTGKKNFTVETDGAKPASYTVVIPSKSEVKIDNIEEGKTVVLIGEPDKTGAAKLTLKAIKIL